MVSMLNMEKKWVFPLVISSLICTILVVTCFDMGLVSSVRKINSFFSNFPAYISMNQRKPGYAELMIDVGPFPPSPGPALPRFAYLVSGSKGDLEKLWRTLHALYHPRNQYVVHLDLEAPTEERLTLASRINNHTVFSKAGNVYMITKANMVTYRGPTMVANTLHACAIHLKRSKDWDWFINLSASDYPLVTQDDLIYAFSDLDRNLNFIEHTSQLGWKADERAMPLIMDPGLYMSTKSDIFWTSQNRKLPTAFKLFTGSAWTVMSHSFVEFCIWGWDNLPRTLLITPHILTLNDSDMMVRSNAAFARKFNQDDAVLDKIDKDLLGREKGSFTPGGWCSGEPKCSEVGDMNKIKPGPGAQRLHQLIATSSSKAILDRDQCK
ncbi:Core-2/I-branching beta-1,6-N-acetylglucosaminyltransferase family protein isoform 2 [Hibiscus syriacus]|uniref:Core-2/I-branching beta-1,6-N-acetylglucosaminyltransferase family protein isoform 2 n=1 Tax=Hibiscus syriacus TaxID=106335 RepID=A0A6A3ARI8_HIBSY|nr:Core-2/I-branching beta-1,6-N-acetylglucosaminyltransferase family protein isoform 2 [Hibiscus syriacus]